MKKLRLGLDGESVDRVWSICYHYVVKLVKWLLHHSDVILTGRLTTPALYVR